MVKCQTSLLALAEVLKKASCDRNAKASLESAQTSVAELLKSFAQFGACSDALSNALTAKSSAKPGPGPKAAVTDAAPAVPVAPVAAPVAPVAAPAATGSKRKAATASAKVKLAAKLQKKEEDDAAFIANSDDASDDESDQGAGADQGAGTDQEEPAPEAEELATMQARNSAPAKRSTRLPPAEAAPVAPPEQELDESSDDEEVLPPD